jgi:hypothetical protein
MWEGLMGKSCPCCGSDMIEGSCAGNLPPVKVNSEAITFRPSGGRLRAALCLECNVFFVPKQDMHVPHGIAGSGPSCPSCGRAMIHATWTDFPPLFNLREQSAHVLMTAVGPVSKIARREELRPESDVCVECGLFGMNNVFMRKYEGDEAQVRQAVEQESTAESRYWRHLGYGAITGATVAAIGFAAMAISWRVWETDGVAWAIAHTLVLFVLGALIGTLFGTLVGIILTRLRRIPPPT